MKQPYDFDLKPLERLWIWLKSFRSKSKLEITFDLKNKNNEIYNYLQKWYEESLKFNHEEYKNIHAKKCDR